MNKKSLLKLVGITVAFLILGVAYTYFNQQSLLSSGKTNADLIVQDIQDGNHTLVKDRLKDFVGGTLPDQNPDYLQALTSVDYVAGLVQAGETLTFTEGHLGSSDGYTVYSGVYEIAAPQGGEDYFLVVLRRDSGEWILANTRLLATDPFVDTE